MTNVEILGYIAAALTTASFVPQAVLVIRTRRTGGISLLMYTLFTLGVALWLAYGIATQAMPIIVANLITLILAGTILFIAAKARFSRRGTLQARAPGTPLEPDQNPDIQI
ncbi:SemiSWEET transporter [Robiginitomaculum antarcticum]|uniref:SemiSWEET transporter n=1 Tax=Robiginitomaculum antarcticum TaxID=437507 RepID=UPI00036A1583|nr:SemiSWEET transporter [Robiginitomaculum antarcticum]